MSIKPYALILGGIALITLNNLALANKVSIAECTKFLSYSNNRFKSLASASQQRAQKIADTLSACQTANVCSDIKGASSYCPGVLATRILVSQYYAHYSPSDDSQQLANQTPAKSNTKKTPQQQAPAPSNNTASNANAPAPTVKAATPEQQEQNDLTSAISNDNNNNIIVPQSSDDNKPAENNKDNQTSPSINWFN